jgi:hypothetical protein
MSKSVILQVIVSSFALVVAFICWMITDGMLCVFWGYFNFEVGIGYGIFY